MGQRAQDAAWLIQNLRPERSHPVGDAGLEALASSIERQELEDGQLLYRQDSEPNGIWAIRSGTVQLTSRPAASRSLVQILRAGDIAGDVPILLRTPSITTAHVRERGTMLFIEAERLRSILSSRADLCYLWLQNLAIRLEGARRRILQLLGDELAQSLARLILDEHVDGRLALSQSALAEMLGAQRTSVNRILQILRRSGTVELSYGGVAVKDWKALEELALANPGGREPGQTTPELRGPAGTPQG